MSDVLEQTIRSECEKAACPMRSRIVLNCLGYAFFAIGVLGMFLPVMPTTVFWIIGAVCFARSNPALYRRIVQHRRFGPAVRDMVEQGVISRRGKSIALFGMSLASAFTIFVLPFGYWMAAALGLIALGAAYVASRPEVSSEAHRVILHDEG